MNNQKQHINCPDCGYFEFIDINGTCQNCVKKHPSPNIFDKKSTLTRSLTLTIKPLGYKKQYKSRGKMCCNCLSADKKLQRQSKIMKYYNLDILCVDCFQEFKKRYEFETSQKEPKPPKAKDIKYKSPLDFPEEKTCTKCNTQKHIRFFYYNTRKTTQGMAYSIYSRCIDCHAQYKKTINELTEEEANKRREYDRKYQKEWLKTPQGKKYYMEKNQSDDYKDRIYLNRVFRYNIDPQYKEKLRENRNKITVLINDKQHINCPTCNSFVFFDINGVCQYCEKNKLENDIEYKKKIQNEKVKKYKLDYKLMHPKTCCNCNATDKKFKNKNKVNQYFNLGDLCVDCHTEFKVKYEAIHPPRKYILKEKVFYKSIFDFPEEKICNKCNISKPIRFFYYNKYKSKNDGMTYQIYPHCNKCHGKHHKRVAELTPEELKKRRRYYKKYNKTEAGIKNIKRTNERKKNRYATDLEYRERIKGYYRNNPKLKVKKDKYQKKYYKKNREKQLAYQKEYVKKKIKEDPEYKKILSERSKKHYHEKIKKQK